MNKELINDDRLCIIARGEQNRKDKVKPVAVLNGIYFYVAYKRYNPGEGLTTAYPSNYTIEMVETAMKHTVDGVVYTRFDYANISSVLTDDYSIDDWDFTENPMCIITTKDRALGSGILFCRDYLEAIKDRIGDYYILPSSIHEIIILPKSDAYTKEDLSRMVSDINATQVAEDELLADRAFEVDEFLAEKFAP